MCKTAISSVKRRNLRDVGHRHRCDSRFLSSKLSETAVLNSTTATTAHEHLDHYLSEVHHLDASSLPPMQYADLLAAKICHIQPSVSCCGGLTLVLRPRRLLLKGSFLSVEYCAAVVAAACTTAQVLGMRACLKLNAQLLTDTGFTC